MHTLYLFFEWLQKSPFGTSIRDSSWQFPLFETVHIFGIILLVGSTSIVDLRLMGLAFKEDTVSKLGHRYLPWAWTGFIVQVVTGALLFASEPVKMYNNGAFQLKMLLIVMAGVNAFVFHFISYRSVGKWENDHKAPLAARLVGTFSIFLWFGIVAAGRWIAYL